MQKKWVIPDIHGCLRSLKALVEDLVVPVAGDQIFFLGDYVDRGPDSKGVIDYVMELQHNGLEVKTLKGNHEDFFLKAWDEDRRSEKVLFFKKPNRSKAQWLIHGGKETLESFGTSDLSAIPLHYMEWMRQLEMFIETDNFLLVHAGLNFEIEDPFADSFAMLWAKDYKINPSKIGNRRLIHGHVPVSLDFIDITINNPSNPYIDLDNGCYMAGRPGYGNLLALELGSMTLKVQPNIDMD
ncbi:MAG TPA: metallophosphoesterase [Lentimicrobium sp.]|jgi:serine/threonine protein phosphatase 1|nr:metallophosphoesterase [Lentimicrobium sp.]